MDGLLFRSLKSQQLPVLRIYGWKYPTVSAGNIQSVSTIKALIGNINVPYYVRRDSSGGCYYHYDEIMVCFISDKKTLSYTGKNSPLLKFSNAIKKTLQTYGISAQRQSSSHGNKNTAKFSPFQRSDYDLFDPQYKPLAVISDKVSRTRYLIHSSVVPQRLTEYSRILEVEPHEFVTGFCNKLSQFMVELYKLPGSKDWKYTENMKQKALQNADQYLLR